MSSPDESGDATLSAGASGRSSGAPPATASIPPKAHTVPPVTTPSPGAAPTEASGNADPVAPIEPLPIEPLRPTPRVSPIAIATTMIGTGPSPIVPRRRTPGTGTVAPVLPKPIPAAGVPAALPVGGAPDGASERIDVRPTAQPAGGFVPPIIRIPHGGMLGPSTPQSGIRTGSFLCEILLRNGAVTQDNVDRAIAIQEERGGQIGRILVSIGACSEDAIARALVDQLKLRKDSGESAAPDVSIAARENKDVAGLEVLTRPELTVATLLFTDLVSLSLAALLATSVHWLRTYAELGFDLSAWLVVGPSMGLCVLTFLGLELYSPMAKSTPDEIRDVVFASSLVHLGASLLATLGNLPIVRWGVLVRSTWWLATLFLVPVFRSLVRNWLCVQPWWGIPVCVLGAAKTGRLIVRTLKAQPRSGLKPVMLLDDDPAKHGTLRATFSNEKMDVYSVNVSAAHFMSESQRKALAEDLFGTDDDELSGPISSDHIPLPPSSWSGRSVVEHAASDSDEKQFLGPESTLKPSKRTVKDASVYPRGKFAEVEGVPVVGDLGLAPILAQRLKIPYAVLAMPGVDSAKLLQIVERVGGKFSHLLVIPDLFGFATLGVPAKNLGGILGVEVRQQLLLPGPRLAKRIMDVALTGAGSLFVLPFLLLIALLIKLDSKGPIFYTQNRLGRDGEFFKAYKFRTMHGDGEARLKAILDADPQLRAEYEIYHKLRKDPRVTRIGRVLRKFSLDEFPQLLNVINGDMSLVGPRPYIERELTEMGGQEKIILRAPPGMTGMWQVSDRNATSFAQRVQIDVYYTRNWSPWLDIHILAKTFGVVVKGSGV